MMLSSATAQQAAAAMMPSCHLQVICSHLHDDCLHIVGLCRAFRLRIVTSVTCPAIARRTTETVVALLGPHLR
jgi:hypothetical protein